MRWVRDEDGSFLVLGRCGCGCSLDFGTKIVGGGRGLRRSVFACLWLSVSKEGVEDANIEGAGALLVGCCVPRSRCDSSVTRSLIRQREKGGRLGGSWEKRNIK